MTSPITPGFPQQDLEGRSVRDVVASSPGEVNDAWCRKVLRKLLKSLELQYAMEMPHRAITPDTVVFHANGEPLLISDDIDAAPAPAAQQADDLTALAGVIHYAITHELAPAGPLNGRVDGYSAAVVATVDACMNPDPALRPRSIDAVRDMLDRVAPVASALPASPPVSIPVPVERTSADAAVEAQHAGKHRGTRWAIAAGGGAVAIALAMVLFPGWRDAGSHDRIVLAPPQTGSVAHPVPPAPGGAAPAGSTAMEAPADQAAIGASGNPTTATAPDRAGIPARPVNEDRPADRASDLAGSAGASSVGTTQSGGGVDQPDAMSRVKPKPAIATATPPDATPANASYQLQIKPWGVVYVDGVERGVSPPVKRLALTPGPHTIRITNPKYRDSILEFESAQTTSNGKIIVDFTDEAQ
jgi:hypothetical protein